MPRINVEDSVFIDWRFSALCVAVGNRMLAIGMLVEGWILAQKFWADGQGYIPLDRFPKELSPLIDSGWAIEKPDGIYLCGSKKQFAWLLHCKEAGRRGGLAKAAKAKQNVAGAKQNVAGAKQNVAGAKQNVASSSSYTSTTNSNTEYGEVKSAPSSGSSNPPRGDVLLSPDVSPVKVRKSRWGEGTRAKAKSFIAAYSDAYQAKYNAAPRCIQSGPSLGRIMDWLTNIDEASAVRLVQTYVMMDNDWFEKKAHDLDTFLRCLNEIGNHETTGHAGGDRWAKFRKLIADKSKQGNTS